MNKNEFLEIISNADYCSDKLYLLEVCSKTSGFFVLNNKIAFLSSNSDSSEDYIKTEYLNFRSKLYISSVENFPSFNDGYFDMLLYNGTVDDEYFQTFYNLCSSFAKTSEISFKDFFNELINLLSIPTEKSYKNLIGLLGELFVIEEFKNKKINIINNWHSDITSIEKYDFVFSNFNLEVKASTSDNNIFKIKNKQLFNDQKNYVCLVCLENDNSGISLNKLVDYYKNETMFNSNIDFMFKLQKELNKTDKAYWDNKFTLKRVTFYLNKDLDNLCNVPECISNIEFDYDFTNANKTDISEILKEITIN